AILGSPIPIKPSLPLVLKELVKTRLALMGKSTEMLKELPVMEDPEKRALMSLIHSAGFPAYFVSPWVHSVIIMRGVQLSVRYGNTPASIHCYTTYGMLLASLLGDIDQGYEFAEVGRALNKKFNDHRGSMMTDFVRYNFIAQWKDGLHKTVKVLPEVYQRGVKNGETAYALGIGLFHSFYSLAIGRPISEVAQETETYLSLMRKVNQKRTLLQQLVLGQTINDLLIEPESGKLLQGEYLESTETLKNIKSANDKVTPFWLLVHRAMIGLTYGHPHSAWEDICKAAPYASASPGQTVLALYHYYRALACLTIAQEHKRPFSVKTALKKTLPSLKKLKKWAHYCAQDFAHKVHLIEAEIAVLKGDKQAAGWHYTEAVSQAAKHGFFNDEAFAAERAARFYQTMGHERVAGSYLKTAFQAYRSWGAEGKVVQLRQQISSLSLANHTTELLSHSTGTHKNSVEEGLSLDLHSILQASQILSGEIALERLLQNLMHIALENAGAQRGALLLPSGPEGDDRWRLEAEGSLEHINVLQSQSLNTEKNLDLPIHLCRFVIQNQHPIVLPNPDEESDLSFLQDPYLRQYAPASALCLPLNNQGQMAGVLYLENYLMRGAFTPRHIEILQVLSSQMAQAIDAYFERSQRNALMNIFSRHVSKDFAQVIWESRDQYLTNGRLRPQRLTATVLFTDLKDFTTIAEYLDPQGLMDWINEYMEAMVQVIEAHHGQVNKFIGDSIMVTFGVPIARNSEAEIAQDACNAVECALAMGEELERLWQKWAKRDLPQVRMRVGIFTGPLVAGSLGSIERQEYTVVGDTVNVASRLEGYEKAMAEGINCRILIGGATLKYLGSKFQTRQIGNTQLKGKSELVNIHLVEGRT
ncbi:MAG: adenylate/guanylate cyclase domain-containing protein, partial [Pseudomonadota bacterium]